MLIFVIFIIILSDSLVDLVIEHLLRVFDTALVFGVEVHVLGLVGAHDAESLRQLG